MIGLLVDVGPFAVMLTFLFMAVLKERRQRAYFAARMERFEDEMRRMQAQLRGAPPEVAKQIEAEMLEVFVEEIVDGTVDGAAPLPARLLRGHGPTTPTGAP